MARQNKKKVTREIWQNNSTKASEDQVACETPIAFVYNGISHFVMMATPSDIEDFVYGKASQRELLSVNQRYTIFKFSTLRQVSKLISTYPLGHFLN